jgi:hypothetical protein
MRRYRLPCFITAAYMMIITGSTIYLSTQDQTKVDAIQLITIIVIICAASAATGWSWHHADREA